MITASEKGIRLAPADELALRRRKEGGERQTMQMRRRQANQLAALLSAPRLRRRKALTALPATPPIVPPGVYACPGHLPTPSYTNQPSTEGPLSSDGSYVGRERRKLSLTPSVGLSL